MNNEDRFDMSPANIISLEYICDYDYAIFAVLKVVLRIDIRKRLYLLKNKRDVRVNLELEKLGLDIDQEFPVTNPEAVLEEIFSVYFSDDDENIDLENLKQRLARNEVGTPTEAASPNDEDYFESENILEMYLFNPKLLKASRYSFNRVYTETTIQNAIAHMLTVSKHNNVLMSKIENYESYRELLIPPNPVYKALLYLDQYFGLYATGATIFYDLGCLYILNTDGNVSAKQEGEWTETVFLIPELEASTPGNGMIRHPEEKIHYASINESDINHQRLSHMTNVSHGSKMKIILSDGTEIINLKADQAYTDDQNETVTYIKKENIFTESIIQARMEENDDIVYVNGNNLDISAFTPNKTFRMIYDEPLKAKKYQGRYRLAMAHHFIRIESEEYSSCSSRFILKKTEAVTE